jgi:predicted DNA-binding transcriptional regulator AlpA
MPRGKTTIPSEIVMYGPHFQRLFGPSRATQRLQIIAGELPKPFQLSPQKKAWLRSTLDEHFAKLHLEANPDLVSKPEPEPDQEAAA